ncbi:LytR/AlgR family response regulator transcription factor [Candidatus Izemoplasma sp. B36]|uniref:LytR/AlgR family response regulator transcription factor n=1 Tax=Candidatus Izemoplasma sp. B36 TaxID=3242468 RepID=UPI003556AFC0
MRICLVDDDSIQLDYLNIIINKWANKNNILSELYFYHSAEEMLFEHPNKYPYDLILLDVQMGNINGIELARKIRKKDKNIIIAFISGMASHVFDGYEVQAIRYILKPVKEKKLYELLDYVNANMIEENSYFIISISGEKKRINYDDIIYFESMGHYIVIHLLDTEFDYKYNISDLCDDLAGTEFIRAHRSYVVNMKYVEKITRNECQLIHSINVPLSRNSYKSVNEKFINYYKEKGA